MADITLAEFNGRVWLVGGDNYIDDFLFNSLPPEITVEIVPCDSREQMLQMWTDMCGEPDGMSDPWLINPAIVDRVRRKLSGHSVFFAEWSAAIESDGHVVIAAAAASWRDNMHATLDLVDYLEPNAPKSIANLSKLRRELIEEALIDKGVPATQIGHVTREPGTDAGNTQERQRVDIVGRMPEAS